jgi:mannose-6-phosphate isomerase-like protein (cupin superfamily)
MADYSVKSISEMERAFGGIFVRARASLGASAFGMNLVDLPPNSDEMYPEHDHLHDGQEEIFLALSGDVDLVLPDRVVEMKPLDTFVRMGPGTRRRLRSGPAGARVLMLGATPGRAYEPQANSVLGGPETFATPTASTSMVPGSYPAQLSLRGRF